MSAVITRLPWGVFSLSSSFLSERQQVSSPRWLSTRAINFLPHGSLHRVNHNISACSPQSKSLVRGKGGDRERQTDGQTGQARRFTIFRNHILEVTFHSFCHFILLAGRQVPRLPQASGEGITQECEYKEVGTIGDNPRGCQPHI